MRVASGDGTPIAYWRSGKGPPLLLIHGATADHTTTWRYVLPAFERHFTTYVMDRRGRGGSGDAERYDLTLEAEDIASIIETIDQPVNVLGHSFGALCAIEAALLSRNMRRLVLYEGVNVRGAETYPPGLIDRLQALLESGDTEGMLVTMFRELVEMPEDEIELLKSQQDAWSVRSRNARTLPREMRVDAAYVFHPRRFEKMSTRTLLMVGQESPARELRNASMVANALPDARVSLLPGQQHVAMYSAPELFVDQVMKFLA